MTRLVAEHGVHWRFVESLDGQADLHVLARSTALLPGPCAVPRHAAAARRPTLPAARLPRASQPPPCGLNVSTLSQLAPCPALPSRERLRHLFLSHVRLDHHFVLRHHWHHAARESARAHASRRPSRSLREGTTPNPLGSVQRCSNTKRRVPLLPIASSPSPAFPVPVPPWRQLALDWLAQTRKGTGSNPISDFPGGTPMKPDRWVVKGGRQKE